jgi:hypothetical protein
MSSIYGKLSKYGPQKRGRMERQKERERRGGKKRCQTTGV